MILRTDTFFFFPTDVVTVVWNLGARHFLWCGKLIIKNTMELVYNIIKGTEYFVSLCKSVFLTEEYNIMVNSEE